MQEAQSARRRGLVGDPGSHSGVLAGIPALFPRREEIEIELAALEHGDGSEGLAGSRRCQGEVPAFSDPVGGGSDSKPWRAPSRLPRLRQTPTRGRGQTLAPKPGSTLAWPPEWKLSDAQPGVACGLRESWLPAQPPSCGLPSRISGRLLFFYSLLDSSGGCHIPWIRRRKPRHPFSDLS